MYHVPVFSVITVVVLGLSQLLYPLTVDCFPRSSRRLNDWTLSPATVLPLRPGELQLGLCQLVWVDLKITQVSHHHRIKNLYCDTASMAQI